MARVSLTVTGTIVVALSFSSALPTTDETTRVNYTGHRLVSVTATTADHVALLSTLADRLRIDIWQHATDAGMPALLRLSPEVVAEFLATTSRSSLHVTTACANLQAMIDNERKALRSTDYSTTATPRFDKYLNYKAFKEALEQYGKKYDHVTYTSIGRSYEGRDLIGVHVNAKENLPIVFLECGIHAREWIAHTACLYMIDQLATQNETNETIRNLLYKYEWRIYPVVNPDGYEFTHTTDRFWRKTRSRSIYSKICRGADANRNFDVGGFCKIKSSPNPCTDTYCGDNAFSEPEARAIRDALQAVQKRTEFYFSVHSFGQLWMFPYGYSRERVPEYNQLLNISLNAKEAIRRVHGSNYTVGPISTTLYGVSGTSVDWAYEYAGVTKSFVLELRPAFSQTTGNLGFILPVEDILPTVQETWEGIKRAVAA
ncbi:zinc carboxypeptidase-like isoform X1 [Amblyomma americanum]